VSHSDAPPEPLAAVLETVLYCTSANEAPTRRFYEDLLRLKKVSRSAYRLGSQVFLLFNSDESRVQKEPPPHGASGTVHTCFLVPPDAYDRWKGYLEANGVGLIDEITWDHGIRSFYFNDPAGNLLEIADGDMWPP
jgi:catechol 2,3-dioxygenase-like lactoylglutathione lyase family enzyme